MASLLVVWIQFVGISYNLVPWVSSFWEYICPQCQQPQSSPLCSFSLLWPGSAAQHNTDHILCCERLDAKRSQVDVTHACLCNMLVGVSGCWPNQTLYITM